MPASHAKQIAIIGAGPAGAIAAIRLAQLGHRVTLFEKATFPRDKVCGECLSSTGIAVLRRLGIADAMHARLRPSILRRAAASTHADDRVIVELPKQMWGLTRRSMDHALADIASEHGVDVRFSTAASVDLRATGRQPVIRSTSASRVGDPCHVNEAFNYALVADGVGRAFGSSPLTGDFGIKTHFRDVDAPRDTIELIALSRGYAGLAPVNDGLWNAAWSVPAESLKTYKGDVDALFRAEVDRSPTLRRRFANATRVNDWLACPLPRYAVRRDWPASVIPLGNAAAALEPVGGEGMGLAMRSAELAAGAIDAAARAKLPVDARRLRRQFDRLWRTRRAACRGGALALSHRFFGPLAIGLTYRAPILARVGLALVGK